MGSCADGTCGCPACAAERQGSPVPQALDFGMRMASAKEGDSKFWQVAAAADTALAVALPGSEDPAAEHVRETMRTVSEFASELGADYQIPHEALVGMGLLLQADDEQESPVHSAPPPARPPGLPEPHAAPAPTPLGPPPPPSRGSDLKAECPPPTPENDWIPWPDRTKRPLSGGDDGSLWAGRGLCCPEEPFHFPKPDSAKQIPGELEGDATGQAATPSFSYEVEANFDPAGEGCNCECCVFRQEVLKNHVSATTGEEGKVGYTELKDAVPGLTVGVADCFWIMFVEYVRVTATSRSTKTRVVSMVGSQDAPPPALKPSDEEAASQAREGFHRTRHWYKGPFCAGGKAAWPEGVPEAGERGQYANEGCRFTWTDKPQIPIVLARPFHFTWTWQVKGAILDRCHNYEVRREKEWLVVWQGAVSKDNKVTMKIASDSQNQGAGAR